ncbi:unnamed protein product [Fraxinus pennsylvanica]|uniref:Uncharacterized protein n=1 Tax=Fraxinus pennsylvanica TaxID=56036 RepID=A0AAD1ZTY5_9LAMI|nr:unnamed protein product [Fraxinus pennsylvanica]
MSCYWLSELLKLLGFQEGKILETNQFDLIFVHVGADEKINDLKDREFMTHLVGELMHMAQLETDIGSRLHVSIIMSYGAALDDENSMFVVSDAKLKINNELSQLFPRQSYPMKGGKPNKNVRHYGPILVAQWQNAVTRKDMVVEFSFRDFIEHGGNLVIPADRFLHEVALKLWKAPNTKVSKKAKLGVQLEQSNGKGADKGQNASNFFHFACFYNVLLNMASSGRLTMEGYFNIYR